MTHKVGPKGQVVIPKMLRAKVGIEPGGEVDFALEDGAVRVFPRQRRTRLRGMLRGAAPFAELERERERELTRDDERAAR